MKNKMYKIDSKSILREAIMPSNTRVFDFYNENKTYGHNHKLHSWAPKFMILEKKEDGYHEILTDLLIVSEGENMTVGEGLYYSINTLITSVTSNEIKENFKGYDNVKMLELTTRMFKFRDKALAAKIVKIRMLKKEIKLQEDRDIEVAKMFRR
jgi:hypothetical protein